MTGRGALTWVAAGAAAFTVYGSLVPFEFRALPLADAARWFRTVLTSGIRIGSRSDTAANVLLGVPLGFALLGLVAFDRGWARAKVAAVGLLLLPACTLFAAGVEFAQIFVVGRYCALADILAQTLGAAFGMAAWVLCGQPVTRVALAVWTGADLDPAGRLLVAYCVFLAFVQVLPLDLSASPADLYRKVRDDVRFVPFGEFAGAPATKRWALLAKLVRGAGLFAPVGLLLAMAKGRFERLTAAHVALAGLALAFCLEAAQLIVHSRSPSATDVLVGGGAVLASWYAARVHHEGLAVPFVLSWCVVWLAAMTPVTQAPPEWPRLDVPRAFDWVPLLPLESGHPLFALEEVLTKLVLFGLLGAVVAAWWLPPRTRRGPPGSVRAGMAIAAAIGLTASAVFENAQRWTTLHTPCVTDVLLGGAGAALGVLVASRARGSVVGQVSSPPPS